MKKLITLAVAPLLAVIFVPAVAFAAKPAPAPQRVSTVEETGYDISYPQCGTKKMPTDQYFGVVGVTGGTAASTNPCLKDQLVWANKSRPGSKQAKVQLYVNTANPGEVISQVTTWPTNNVDETGVTTANPYGTCAGANDRACSWQYGWNRAVEANVDRFAPAARAAGIYQSGGAYTWWLDVETQNTWETSSTDALARNTATLEGMTSYFKSLGGSVGLYSTAVQWGQITGDTVSADSNLKGLANWRPSGASLTNAKANCTVVPLTTGGFISLTQYTTKSLDYDHSCI